MLVSSQLYTVILDLIPPFSFYCNLFYSNSALAAKDVTVQYGHLQCIIFFLDCTRPFQGYKNFLGRLFFFFTVIKKKHKENYLIGTTQ